MKLCWQNSILRVACRNFSFKDSQSQLNVQFPTSHWEDKENIKNFILKLAKNHSIEQKEDWKKINKQNIIKIGGENIFKIYPNLNIILNSVFPNENWDFLKQQKNIKPKKFWQKIENQRLFLDEFAKSNQIYSYSDWKKVNGKMIIDFGGAQLLRQYSSLFNALQTIYPEYNWNPFENTLSLPKTFWKQKENQILFLNYFAAKKSIKNLEDWKTINTVDIVNEGGSTFLKQFPDFSRALSILYPELEKEWNPLLVRKNVSRNYWNNLDNIKQFLIKFENEFEINDKEDYYRISINQFKYFGGAGILKKYNFKFISLLKDVYPDFNWNEEKLKFTNKLAEQRRLFILVKRLYPKFQVIENFLFSPVVTSGFEIDVYIPELKLGFEYQGIQHFKDSPHMGSVDMYQNRDNAKKSACEANDINLVIVPYWWDGTLPSLENLIKEYT